MRFSKNRALLFVGCSFLLAGCGDGWETVEYSGRVPYTLERTAGSGVEYVRARMKPEKQLKLADGLEDQLAGTKGKGYGSKRVHEVQPHAGSEDFSGRDFEAIDPAAGPAEDMGAAEPTSEQIMMQKLLQDEEGLEGAYSTSAQNQNRITASAIEPAAGNFAQSNAGSVVIDPPPVSAASDDELSGESASGFISEKQIVVPKSQMFQPLSEGERQLNEIYEDGVFETQD
ncbi:MAG: hypothetical protein KDI90_11065 [Alphaproteobacteria bacterium]|nr:hypothetical protein [Alphaproteobacteria bacterium]MCB9974732.1 hypothetical protein [Rhodospirillales bacterium]